MLRIVFLCSWCLFTEEKNESQTWNTIDTNASSWKADVTRRGSGLSAYPICSLRNVSTGLWPRFPTENPEIWEGIPWYYLFSGVTIITTYCICIVSISCLKIWNQEVKVSDQKWHFILGCFHCDSLQCSAFNKPHEIISSQTLLTSNTSYAAAGLPHIPKSLVRGRWWHVRQYCSEHVSRVA